MEIGQERVAALEAENEELKAHVAALVAEQRRVEQRLRESAALLQDVIDNATSLFYAKDQEGRFFLLNRGLEAFFGCVRGAALGKTDADFLPGEVAEVLRQQDKQAMASGPMTFDDLVPGVDGLHAYITTKFPLRREDGVVYGVCGMSTDITERVRVEEDRRRLQDQLLRAHEEALRALSTPLLPIAPGVLLMPLIGDFTRERAQQILAPLLHGVATQQARIAILDVTGVPSAGGEVTSVIVGAARAVRLLGAELVITGIRPSIAQSLVELGEELEGIVTRSTLQSGVQYALGR